MVTKILVTALLLFQLWVLLYTVPELMLLTFPITLILLGVVQEYSKLEYEIK